MSEQPGQSSGAGQPAGADRLGTLYERLMAINREAFQTGLYDIAYHALAAALNWAEVKNDKGALVAVERTAGEQLRFIDQHDPAYHHSSKSASSRGHVSIFAVLGHQAHARLLIVQHRQEEAAPPSLGKAGQGE